MKTTTTKSLITAVVSAASFAFVLSVSAEVTPVTELPAQAARQVADAKVDQRAEMTKTVVVKAVAQKPTIAPAVVSAIAKGSPEMAADAAVAAAVQEPSQIGAITKAAVAAAHSQAGQIVAAICKQFPTKYNLVAMAAFEAAPEASKEILSAVTASVPAVKSLVARAASTSLPGVIAETQDMLKTQVREMNTTPESFLTVPEAKAVAVSSPAALPPAKVMAAYTPAFSPVALPPPTSGGAFTTPVGTPTEVNGGDTHVVPAGGGRDYSN